MNGNILFLLLIDMIGEYIPMGLKLLSGILKYKYKKIHYM